MKYYAETHEWVEIVDGIARSALQNLRPRSSVI